VLLVVRWIINALALLALPYLFSTIQVKDFTAALIAALVLGLINALIRPVVLILTLPINILTLGLLTFVINALLFLFAADLVSGFHVEGFWPALWGSIVYSLISAVASHVLLDSHSRPPAGN
jgi:putative membrane protein